MVRFHSDALPIRRELSARKETMDFKEFSTRILEKVNALLPDGLSANFQTIQKNNGVSYTCLCLDPCREREASPAIYMEPVFDMLTEGDDAELYKVAEQLSGLLVKQAPQYLNPAVFDDAGYAKAHLVYRLSGLKGNEAWLSHVVYREYLDMAITYAIILNEGEPDTGLVSVSRELMEHWHFTEEELFSYAHENTKRIFGDNLAGFYDALPGENGEGPRTVYILSNRENFYGAAVILYSEELKSLADRLQSDLFLLPASIHEVIILPWKKEDYPFMLRTVMKVNEAEEKKENVLTDNVYVYERETGKIRIAP